MELWLTESEFIWRQRQMWSRCNGTAASLCCIALCHRKFQRFLKSIKQVKIPPSFPFLLKGSPHPVPAHSAWRSLLSWGGETPKPFLPIALALDSAEDRGKTSWYGWEVPFYKSALDRVGGNYSAARILPLSPPQLSPAPTQTTGCRASCQTILYKLSFVIPKSILDLALNFSKPFEQILFSLN